MTSFGGTMAHLTHFGLLHNGGKSSLKEHSNLTLFDMGFERRKILAPSIESFDELLEKSDNLSQFPKHTVKSRVPPLLALTHMQAFSDLL